jgi:hypothetical protein
LKVAGGNKSLAETALNSGVQSEVDFLHVLDNTRKAEDASFLFLNKGKRTMQTLPKRMRHGLRHVEETFSEGVWEWATWLLIGAILVPGERTVTTIVRVMGCLQEKPFQNSHRVLTRATWSSRERSRRLLVVRVGLCVPGNEPVVMGSDDTIERRRGRTRRLSRSGVFEQGVLCENP